MKIIIVISIVSFIFFLFFIILWACIKYSYRKEIEDIFEWFETLDFTSKNVNNFFLTMKLYKKILKEYNINRPTKLGKNILNSLYKLYYLLKSYEKSKQFIKDNDLIKATDFQNVIDNCISETIEVIEMDISIIKNKYLIQITNMIKNFYK